MRIDEAISDVEVLLALAPEELAPYVLRTAVQPEMAGLQALTVHGIVEPNRPLGHQHLWASRIFNGSRNAEVERSVREALQWLESQVLVMRRDTSMWDVTRKGSMLLEQTAFVAYVQAASFPKALLHPSIAEKVWLALVRDDLDVAVLAAFKAVEIAVRKAAGYSAGQIGVPMMRAAFNPNGGPLSRGETASEREALSALFAGAIGSYKNPHSHRTVTITDRTEAQEQVMLASHLLRIVDGFKR